MRSWPSGCRDTDSCARHKRCMYVQCQHEHTPIADIIRYREHIRDINRMNDKGEIPQNTTQEKT